MVAMGPYTLVLRYMYLPTLCVSVMVVLNPAAVPLCVVNLSL